MVPDLRLPRHLTHPLRNDPIYTISTQTQTQTQTQTTLHGIVCWLEELRGANIYIYVRCFGSLIARDALLL